MAISVLCTGYVFSTPAGFLLPKSPICHLSRTTHPNSVKAGFGRIEYFFDCPIASPSILWYFQWFAGFYMVTLLRMGDLHE